MNRIPKIQFVILIFIAIFCLGLCPLHSSLKDREVRMFFAHYHDESAIYPPRIQEEIVRQLKASGIRLIHDTAYTYKFSNTDLLKKIEAFKPTIVFITGDKNCADMMTPLMAKKIPVFFTDVSGKPSEKSWIKNEWKNFQSGIFQNPNVEGSFSVLSALNGKKPRKIIILSGDFYEAKTLTADIMEELKAVDNSISVSIHNEKYQEKWIKIIETASSKFDTIWLLMPFYVVKKSSGKAASFEEIGTAVRKYLKIPSVGVGSVTGAVPRLFSYSMTPESLGRQSAIQIFRYLQGEKLSAIGFDKFKLHELKFNEEEMKRMNLKLPESLFGFPRFEK